MNTMLKGNGNIIAQIKKFAQDIQRSGKDPQIILDELIKSGKYTNEQIEQAKKMAQMFIGKM